MELLHYEFFLLFQTTYAGCVVTDYYVTHDALLDQVEVVLAVFLKDLAELLLEIRLNVFGLLGVLETGFDLGDEAFCDVIFEESL